MTPEQLEKAKGIDCNLRALRRKKLTLDAFTDKSLKEDSEGNAIKVRQARLRVRVEDGVNKPKAFWTSETDLEITGVIEACTLRILKIVNKRILKLEKEFSKL